jgi:adenylate cyclase
MNASRASAGQPIFEVDIALHQGELMYGNIGSRDRLDFTVIGPAVNEVSRMEALCSELGVPILISRKFYDLARSSELETGLKSMGFHELRGVREPQELITLEDG